VAALIGGGTTPTTMPMVPVANESRVPMISIGSADAIVEPVAERQWVFKTPSNTGTVVARLLGYLNDHRLGRVGCLSVDNAYGDAGRAELDRAAPGAGIAVTASERFGAADSDLKPQLSRVRATNPDAIVAWAIPPAASILDKNARELGLAAPLIHDDGAASHVYQELAGDAAEGSIIVSRKTMVADQLSDDDPVKAVATDYLREYQTRCGRKGGGPDAATHDALLLITRAAETAGADRARLRDALELLRDVVGATGVFNLSATDHNGLTERDLVVAQIRGAGGSWRSERPAHAPRSGRAAPAGSLGAGRRRRLRLHRGRVRHDPCRDRLHQLCPGRARHGGRAGCRRPRRGRPAAPDRLPGRHRRGRVAVGLLIERAAVAPVRSCSPLVVLVMTVAASGVLRGLALLVFGTSPYALPPFMAGPPLSLGGAAIGRRELWVLALTAASMVMLYLFLERTPVGTAMRATAANPTASRLVGIRPATMSLLAFGLSALLAGVAGVAVAPITLASYDMGLALGLKGFVAAELGGINSAPGAVLGGLLLGVLESLGAGLISSAYKDAFAFGVLLLALVLPPDGLRANARPARA
jgi:branched-chain amino acid transport system substrate-binding protein